MYAFLGDRFRTGHPPRFINIDANTDSHAPGQNRQQLTWRLHSFLSNKDRGYKAFFLRFRWLALRYGDSWRWRP